MIKFPHNHLMEFLSDHKVPFEVTITDFYIDGGIKYFVLCTFQLPSHIPVEERRPFVRLRELGSDYDNYSGWFSSFHYDEVYEACHEWLDELHEIYPNLKIEKNIYFTYGQPKAP